MAKDREGLQNRPTAYDIFARCRAGNIVNTVFAFWRNVLSISLCKLFRDRFAARKFARAPCDQKPASGKMQGFCHIFVILRSVRSTFYGASL